MKKMSPASYFAIV